MYMSEEKEKLIRIEETEEMPENYDIPKKTKLSGMPPSRMKTYKIPKGTILYHGTTHKETFNPYNIKLGEDKLVSFFSTEIRLAADYILGCAEYPKSKGYVHSFEVVKDIDNMLVVSLFDLDEKWGLEYIDNKFCSRDAEDKYNGVAFFFPRLYDSYNLEPELKELLQKRDNKNVTMDNEFAICNPHRYLAYIHTQRCMAKRKMSGLYNFSNSSIKLQSNNVLSEKNEALKKELADIKEEIKQKEKELKSESKTEEQ